MATHVAVKEFHARHDDEMSLREGDQLSIETENQGWMEGVNMNTGSFDAE